MKRHSPGIVQSIMYNRPQQTTQNHTIDVNELLQELEKLKEENGHLKKAVGNMAITNEILQTAVDVLKKNQRSEKLKSPKK